MTTSKIYYRSIFISDTHLGNKDCHSDYLLDFLQKSECKTLYLIGDIVDMLALKKRLFWPSSHYQIIKTIQKKAANGTEVIYIPGNHDAPIRSFVSGEFLQVKIHRSYVHKTLSGKKLWLVHGDDFDHAIVYRALNKFIGVYAHDFAVFLNRWTHRVRRILGLPYWSFANYLKQHVGKAREAIDSFENAVAEAAQLKGFDGVICGHIHKPEMRKINGVLYCNDGDWTESCSALVETLSGQLQLLHYTETKDTVKNYCPETGAIESAIG